MKNLNNTEPNEWEQYKLDEPYLENPPLIPRPRPNLSQPENRLEMMYCWRYWLQLIQDPTHTRDVLDTIENVPVYSAPWGNDSRHMYAKTKKRTLRKEQKRNLYK